MPFYLWIVGIFPILHLYAANFGLVRDDEVAILLAAVLVGTSLAWVLAVPLFPNPHRRAVLLTIWSLAYSLSGRFYEEMFFPRSLVAWTLGALVLAGLVTLALRRRLSKAACVQLTAPLNLAFGALLALHLISIVSDALAARSYLSANAAYFQTPEARQVAAKVTDSPERPDIYFIIPDSYGSDSKLLSALDYDNSAFTQALRERGFVIAPQAHSNYAFTHASLASILNMRYYESNPSEFADLDYLRLKAANSVVAQQLQQLGYSYIHHVSGFMFPSPIAEINRNFGPGGEYDFQFAALASPHQHLGSLRQPFAPLYINTTLLRGLRSFLSDWLPASKFETWGRRSGERFFAALYDLESVAAMPEATFTITHLLQPHNPVIVNEHGDLIQQIKYPNRDEAVANLQGSNLHFLRVIDGILGRSPHSVIIFQADHGMWTPDDSVGQHNVYAAYYLPPGYEMRLPRPYTLVNSFPLILNAVFGLDIPLLPDRLFQLEPGAGMGNSFDQRELTEQFLREQAQGTTGGGK